MTSRTATEQATPTTYAAPEPLCLQGLLQCRKGGSGSFFRWKRRFVHLDLLDGGSIIIYRAGGGEQNNGNISQQQNLEMKSSSDSLVPPPIPAMMTVEAQLHRSVSTRAPQKFEKTQVDMCIPADWPWMAKDVENDASSFVIEIPTSESLAEFMNHQQQQHGDYDDYRSQDDQSDDDDDSSAASSCESDPDFNRDSFRAGAVAPLPSIHEEPVKDMARAKSLGKPFRIYFRCKSSSSSNEKGLWLRAFVRLGRLSQDKRRTKHVMWSLPFVPHRARIRTFRDAILARDARRLDLDEDNSSSVNDSSSNNNNSNRNSNHNSCNVHIANDVEHQVRHELRLGMQQESREYRVQPSYAYPHRWMTRQEMRDEMALPSSTFHDLRVPDSEQREIGSFQVEVLQCIGLPKLDRVSDTDAAVYLVCGAYAFTTDIISNRANPMWLRNSRRACIFPLFKGYARFYAGVFDDDGRRVKDDFAGRIVVDLARVRPGTTHDVTIPLRLSTHVYSRRRRGAIRLRFTLNWKSDRDALLSYIPRTLKIPLPQNSKPNTGVTVACADEKAFRNICITVHGVHLPGRFTFQQMRAAIREINFTRKFVLTSIRVELRNTRQWKNPGISAYVFFTWMHSIYANSFSLVPAYLIFYLLLQLIRNYARYGIDGPAQRGFVPPSWEEMFSALLSKDKENNSIEPLELGLRPLPLRRRRTSESLYNSDVEHFKYKASTHVPKGKWFFRALGLMPNSSTPTRKRTTTALRALEDEDHLEFPFADGRMYPKFTVKEALVMRKTEEGDGTDVQDDDKADSLERGDGSYQVTATRNGEIRTMMPKFDMHLDELMRKNSSAFADPDLERNYFAPHKAMYYTGKKAGRKAASTITYAASEITEKTGLHTVVYPIKDGIGTGLNHVRDGVSSGVDLLSPSHWRHGSHEGGGVSAAAGGGGPQNKERVPSQRVYSLDFGPVESPPRSSTRRRARSDELSSVGFDSHYTYKTHNGTTQSEITSVDSLGFEGEEEEEASTQSLMIPDDWARAQQPVQNIDVMGPSTGRRLTDDLDEIKDKMHELTWHLFDDRAYILDGKESVYFGHAKRPEKRRKKDVARRLDKLLHIGQYSHSNPFVARVGSYVEPIIGSAYSFLCLFRAGFNVVTWRDPMLTFWLTLALAIVGTVLLFFPWRIFLFLVGSILVGPQNWLIRILREKGHLAPLKTKQKQSVSALSIDGQENDRLRGQPIFSNTRPNRNGVVSSPKVEPCEIHKVVVPSNPLIHQRFFDWPPEPQYAQASATSTDRRRRNNKPKSPVRPKRIRRGKSNESITSVPSSTLRRRTFSDHSRSNWGLKSA